MAKKTSDYKKDIIKALKAASKYSKSLDAQIMALAGAMRAQALASDEIDELDKCVVEEVSRYGNKKLSPHPAFKIQHDAQESITKQMKILGLTSEELAGADEDDPLYNLTKKVVDVARRKPTIISPSDR